jgi:hypothetical protein
MLRVMTRIAIVLTSFLCTGGLWAGQIIDQSYPDPPYPLTNADQGQINLDNAIYPHDLANIGQTFTPTLSSLNFFTFYLQDQHPGNLEGASFYVQILGPDFSTVLATSNTATVPDSWGAPPAGGFNPVDGAPVEFDFTTSVALTPGMTYEAEIFKVSGDSYWADLGASAPGYAGGSYTSPSSPYDDLYFAEGITTQSVPEPGSFTLLAWPSMLLAFRFAGTKSRRKRLLGHF